MGKKTKKIYISGVLLTKNKYSCTIDIDINQNHATIKKYVDSKDNITTLRSRKYKIKYEDVEIGDVVSVKCLVLFKKGRLRVIPDVITFISKYGEIAPKTIVTRIRRSK